MKVKSILAASLLLALAASGLAQTSTFSRIEFDGSQSSYVDGSGNPQVYGASSTFEGEAGMFGGLVLQSRSSADRPILFVTVERRLKCTA